MSLVKVFKKPALIFSLVLFSISASAGNLLNSTVDDLDTGWWLRTFNFFSQYHLSQESLDSNKTADAARALAENYDPRKVTFLQSEVDAFSQKAKDFRNVRGMLAAALDFKKLLATRMQEKVEYLRDYAKGGLDLTSDVAVPTPKGREKSSFPADMSEMQGLWETFFKYEVASGVTVAGKTLDDAIEARLLAIEDQIKVLKLESADSAVTDFSNALTSLYDPHSTYFSEAQLRNFQISMSLSLQGIGATLGMEGGIPEIKSLIEGGPAQLEGSLRVGDRVLGVAQGNKDFVDVSAMALMEVIELIRGERGTTVRLKVARPSESQKQLEISIVRDQVKLDEEEATGKVLTQDGVKIGVLTLPSFYIDFEARANNDPNYKSSATDVKAILEDFNSEGIDALVFDLRGNGGGSLDEAQKIVGFFVGEGPAVQILQSTDPEPTVLFTGVKNALYEGPMTVLVNQRSASASEIVAGALQDYGRAVIAGDQHTFGKGTVQNILHLNQIRLNYFSPALADSGALKMTVSQFFRPAGASTQLRGVVSDIVLPSLTNGDSVSERAQKNAFPWRKVETSLHGRFGRKAVDRSALFSDLRQLSQERVSGSNFFQKLEKFAEDIRAQELAEVVKLSDVSLASKKKKELNDWLKEQMTSSDVDPYIQEAGKILLDWIEIEQTSSQLRAAS